MTRRISTLALFSSLMLFGLSSASAEEPASGGLDSLLDNMPTIESKAAPVEEAAPVEAEVDLASYIKDCRAAVLAKWAPKAKVIKKNPTMEAQILVKLGEDGSILSLSPAKMSDNKSFDESAIEALNAATPLPAPPTALIQEAERGIVIIFSAAKYGK